MLRALFRMYPYRGRITLDGVDISTLPAQLLRSRLAIIPQVSMNLLLKFGIGVVVGVAAQLMRSRFAFAPQASLHLLLLWSVLEVVVVVVVAVVAIIGSVGFVVAPVVAAAVSPVFTVTLLNHSQRLSPLHLGRQPLRWQEPLLFHGTIRENLDHSGEYTDADLWQALRRSRLTSQNEGGVDDVGTADSSPRNWTTDRSKRACLNGDEDGARFGLETELRGNAFNMSAGESMVRSRQLALTSYLVCLTDFVVCCIFVPLYPCRL